MGLITCVHFAELPSMEVTPAFFASRLLRQIRFSQEADDILLFKPSRLGHGCFMTDAQVDTCLSLLSFHHTLSAAVCSKACVAFRGARLLSCDVPRMMRHT